IMAYDNSVVDALAQARGEVEVILADLNATQDELDEQKAQLDAQRAEQADKVAEAQAVMDEIIADQRHLEALAKEAEQEEKEIERQIAKKEKELEEMIKAAQFNVGSGYVYPLPTSYTTITSRFGPRTHPLTGKYNNHSGADISAPARTEIKAVMGGVVVTSAYSPNLWGEYVVINHGNGMTTLYAHMTRGSRKVKEGDIVSQGQVIGLVGTTGLSTGNHLHLTLTINGQKADPLTTFWPNVKFDYRD
ncbi:MAG: peptidoglycan DD-metalloendopeptidase family protein, partial [Oscillospiraceae bacterium]|nr:peptidoglycan DD-metalloendopeptidase family protein [Oscillospiraceae bacterium]